MQQSQSNGEFKLDLHAASAADVYLACPHLDAAAWALVKDLDQDTIAAAGDFPDVEFDAERARRIMAGCAGVLAVLTEAGNDSPSFTRVVRELRLAAELGLPLAVIHHSSVPVTLEASAAATTLQLADAEPIAVSPSSLHGPFAFGDRAGGRELRAALGNFVPAVVREAVAVRPYAFLIGRLERDFTHARAAIRAAVEAEAGISCLWADDGRHQTNVDSIRENTRLLIKHANFVIADLTLGVESPERENPSRAHEIGMSIGYERKLMLSSQEPRRDPYFSIGDMQMVFWTNEDDLYSTVRSWIRPRRHAIGRWVFNHQLPDVYPDYDARLGQPAFAYDPSQRYIGPKTDLSRG